MIVQTNKELRERDPNDFYPTPNGLATAMVGLLNDRYLGREPRVLDPGAGTGVFGDAVRGAFPDARIDGVDIRPLQKPASYDNWSTWDFTTGWSSHPLYDLIIGNPPYKDAEVFIRYSMDLLKPGGQVLFLLRLNFLGSQKRARGLWQEHPPVKVWALPKRPSFTGNKRTDATEYAVFLWQHAWHSETTLGWLDWAYHPETHQMALFEEVQP